MLDSFIAANAGKVLSFDNVPYNAGQSPQLVALWCQYIGLPFQWANAADWWDGSDENFLQYWDRVINDRADGSQLPKPGDIIIFDASLPGSGGCGFNNVFVRNIGPNSWEGFDANWGGKSAHFQSHNWSYVLGWFTPKNPSVVEMNTPTPIADEAPCEPFDLIELDAGGKVVTLTGSPSILYNLNDVSWESFNDNPAGQSEAGLELEIAGVAKHRLGGTYYMPDISRAEGYRVSDCQEAEAVEQEIVADPEPVVSKAKPTMRSPMYASSRTNTIRIREPIPKYGSLSDAANGTNPIGEFRPDEYFIFKSLSGMLSITRSLGTPTGEWINPADNEPKPEPPVKKWQDSYDPFRDQFGNIAPRYYLAREDDEVVDLEGIRKNLPLLRRQPILIGGVFQGPDGEWYARPDDAAQRFMYYGVRRENLQRMKESSPEPEAEPLEIVDPPLRIRDRITSVLQNPHLVKVFDIVKPKYKE
jgi:hypothetical protein